MSACWWIRSEFALVHLSQTWGMILRGQLALPASRLPVVRLLPCARMRSWGKAMPSCVCVCVSTKNIEKICFKQGVTPFIYYMLVLLDCYICYRIVSVSILAIPSGSNTWYRIHSISAGTSHHYQSVQ